MGIFLREQLLQDLLLDRYVETFLFEGDIERLFLVSMLLSQVEAEVVLALKISERLNNELFAQLLLFIVLKVGIEYETDTATVHDMVTEPNLHPLNILRYASKTIFQSVLFLDLSQVLLGRENVDLGLF